MLAQADALGHGLVRRQDAAIDHGGQHRGSVEVRARLNHVQDGLHPVAIVVIAIVVAGVVMVVGFTGPVGERMTRRGAVIARMRRRRPRKVVPREHGDQQQDDPAAHRRILVGSTGTPHDAQRMA